MKLRNLLDGCALALLVINGPVAAETIQSHKSIQSAAENFITEKAAASHGRIPIARAGNLDSRLRLKECDEPLEAFQPAGGRTLGNTTVGVRCPGAQPWTLYVPVKVSILEAVVVAARALSKGMILEEHDVKLSENDLADIRPGYFLDQAQVIGKQVIRSVSMGAAITTSQVKPKIQVKRGQQIDLVAVSHGLKVRMTGEALSDGASGERIRVRNLSTRVVLEGVVQSETTVRISL